MFTDRIPDSAEVLLSLTPEELGLRMLPRLCGVLAGYNGRTDATLFTRVVLGAVGEAGNSLTALTYPAAAQALQEGWTWLEGQALLIPDISQPQPTPFRRVSRRGMELAKAADPVRAFGERLMPKASLHPSIREDVWSAFHRGKYGTAVFEAMRAVEIAVRNTGGFTPKDMGVPLMRRAFDPDKGPLTVKDDEYPEREARAALFAGAIGSYKNPGSHRKVELTDPVEAAEIIALANHLLRIVDSRRQTDAELC